MRVEIRFHLPTATFVTEYQVTATLDGRPEYVDLLLKALRDAAAKIDGLEEATA